MWDVYTAMHVLTTGSYKLLPKSIEVGSSRLSSDLGVGGRVRVWVDSATTHVQNAVNFRETMSPDMLEATLRRLNDQLHTRLLSSKVPPQFQTVRVGESCLSVGCCVLQFVTRPTERGMAYLTVPGEFEVP